MMVQVYVTLLTNQSRLLHRRVVTPFSNLIGSWTMEAPINKHSSLVNATQAV